MTVFVNEKAGTGRAWHKAIETAGNLLGIGLLSLEQIAQATALPIEQVEQLRRELSAVNA